MANESGLTQEEALRRTNKKYKEELAKQDIELERVRFENDMIFKKLHKVVTSQRGKGKSFDRFRVENAHELDLVFNTKVNYVDHLQKKLIELKNSFRTFDYDKMMFEKKELQESVENLKKQIQKKNMELKDMGIENETLKKELNSRPKNVDALQVEKMEKKVVKSNRELAAIRTKNRDMIAEIDKLKRDLRELKNEQREQLENLGKEKDIEIQKLKTQLEGRDRQIEMIEEMKRVEKKKREMERKKREEREKERLRKMKEAPKVEKKKREKPVEVVIEAPREDAGLEDLREDLERALDQIKIKNEFISELEKDHDELNQEFEKLQREYESKQDEMADLDEQLQTTADEVMKFSTQLAAAETEKTELKDEVNRLKKEVLSLETKEAQNKKLIKEEGDKVAEMKKLLGEKEVELENLKDEFEKAKKRAEDLENQGRESEVEAAEKVILVGKVQALEESMAQLEESKIEMKKEIEEKQNELTELKNQVSHLEVELKDLQASLEEAREEADRVKDTMNQAVEKASIAELERDQAVGGREQDAKELKTLQERLLDYNTYRDKAASYDKLKDEVIILRDIANNFEIFKKNAGNVMKITEENQELLKNKLELEKTISQMREVKEEDDKLLADLREEVAGKDEMMDIAVERTMKKVEAANEEREILRAKLDETQKELGHFVSEIYFVEIMLEEKESLLSKIGKKMEEMESASSDLQGYILKNKEIIKERDRLKEDIEDLTEKVREAIRMEMDLKEEKRQMEEHARRREEDIAKLKEPLKMIAGLEKKVRSQYEQIINMVVEINAKKKTIAEKEKVEEERVKRLAELEELERMLRQRNELLENSLSEERRQRDEVLRRERDKMLLEVENRGLNETLGGLEKLHDKIREKDREITDLKETIRKMNNGVSDFVSTAELARVKGDLMETRRMLGVANDKIERVEEDKEKLEEERRLLSKKTRELEIKLEEKREEMSGLALRANELTVKMNESMLREQSLGREVAELKDILEYKNQLSRLETEKEMNLREKLTEAESLRRESEEKMREAQRNLRKEEERAERLERENRTLEDNQIHTTASFVDRFNSKQREVDQHKANATYYEEKYQLMRDKKADAEKKCKHLENAIRKAGGSLIGDEDAISKSIARGGNSRVNQLAVLKDIEDRAKDQEKIRKLQSDVKRLEKANAEMRKDMEGKVYMHAGDREGLQNQITDLQEKLDKSQRRLKEVTEKAWEADKLRQTVSKMKKLEEDMLKQEAFKKTQMDQMEREVEELGYMLDKKVADNNQRIREKEKLLGEKGEQGAEIIRLSKRVRELEQENAELEEKLRDAKRDKNYLEKTNKEKDKAIEKQEFEIEQKDRKRKQLEEKIEKKEESIQKLETERERLRGELENKRKECVQLLAEKKQISERAEKEFAEEQKLREKEGKLRKEYGEENLAMKEKIVDLEKKVATQQKDFEEASNESENLINTLKKTENDLRGNIVRKKQRIKELEKDLGKTDNQKMLKLVEENKSLHNQMDKMDLLMEKTQNKVKGIADENAKLREALKKVQNDPMLGKGNIQKMNDEFNQIKMEVEKVQKEQARKLAQSKKENLQLQERLKSKQEELDRVSRLVDTNFKAED